MACVARRWRAKCFLHHYSNLTTKEATIQIPSVNIFFELPFFWSASGPVAQNLLPLTRSEIHWRAGLRRTPSRRRAHSHPSPEHQEYSRQEEYALSCGSRRASPSCRQRRDAITQ